MTQMNQIGYGTYKISADEAKSLVTQALQLGYTHFDCAYAYGNEKQVGEAFGEWFSTHDRHLYFITTKLWHTFHKPENVRLQFEYSLKELQLDYIDQFVIHWPIYLYHGKEKFPKDAEGNILFERGFGLRDTWRAMEKLVDSKLCTYIGVSNFTVYQLQDLLSFSVIKPYSCYIEIHPYFYNETMIRFCLQNNVRITAYSPLGGTYVTNSGVAGKNAIYLLVNCVYLQKIAYNHEKTVAQVILKWHLYKYETDLYAVIPRSKSQENMKLNLDLNFTLKYEEIDYINHLNSNSRFCATFDAFGVPMFD